MGSTNLSVPICANRESGINFDELIDVQGQAILHHSLPLPNLRPEIICFSHSFLFFHLGWYP